MYTVAEITTPDGVFFTARNDDRDPTEVVDDGIVGFTKAGAQSPIYQSLFQHQVCFVKNIFTGLNKAEAEAKKKTLIEYARVKGNRVLNVR
jgi:hypothetical protein